MMRRETRWLREGLWVGEGRREEGPEWEGRWSRSRGGVMTVEGRAAMMWWVRCGEEGGEVVEGRAVGRGEMRRRGTGVGGKME